MAGQPFRGGGAIGGKMDKLGIVAGPIEDENRADRGPFLDRELEVAVHRKRPVDAQDNRPLAAIVPLVEGDGGRDRNVADTYSGLFADQATARVAGLPGGKLLAVAFRMEPEPGVDLT